jgi:diadenylate cyclase
MNTELIKNYFVSGYHIFLEQIKLYADYLALQLTLPVVIELAILVAILAWLGFRIKNTTLVRLVPKLILFAVLLLVSNFLGFLAVFYLLAVLLVIFLIASMNIYQSDIRQIVENLFISQRVWNKVQPLDQRELPGFVKDLSDVVGLLAKSHVPSILIIKTSKSLQRLAETGMPMNAPFRKDLVLEIFSHRSNLSNGAMIIDNGIIQAIGANLIPLSNKKLQFSLSNPVVKQIAGSFNALVIITHKDDDNLSLLHGENVYSKLAPGSLDRVLKNIFLSK